MSETNNIKVERARRGISQLELATEVDLCQATIHKIERRPISAKTEHLVRIADYFGVSVDYLLGRETR